MSGDYTIGRLRGKLAIVFKDARGRRHRHTLDTADPGEAQRLAPALHAELTRPTGSTVKDLWDAYLVEKKGRAIVRHMKSTWKALAPRFAAMSATAIAVADCRAHVAARREAGIKEWTIYGELSDLRTVLSWAAKNGIIDKSPHIERPAQPPPKADFFTRQQISALIGAAETPHVRLFIILAIGTGARRQALFELTWDRVDFLRKLIFLKDPAVTSVLKGRAVVPMNSMVEKALLQAKAGALSDFVIEWGGHPVKAVTRGLTSTGNRAGLKNVTAHMFRHSAAVHMAEDGISMEEIAQYLGHTNIATTRKVYAIYSPTFLRRAAAALEYDT